MATPTDPSPLARGAASTPIARELDAILSVRGAEREELLLGAKNLPAVVAFLPPEELFFTLKEMGEDTAPEILRHARPQQVQFLLDLELWRKDRLRSDRVGPWLNRLEECGPDALRRWLHGVDLSTWALLLGSSARIRVADEDTDPFQDTPGYAPFTLDGVYYVSAPAGMEDLIREALAMARAEDLHLYNRLVEAMMRDVDSELEEACYQERQQRLAERGFPEWEEAYSVYARLPVDRLDLLPPRSPSPPRDPEEPAPASPRYVVALSGDAPDLLLRALRRTAQSPAAEAVRSDLANLTNKVLVADGLDLAELDSFGRAMRKTAGYLSIGLEYLCGPDEEGAARALERHWLQDLFRVGWTQVRSVQSKARRFFDKGWPSGKMERLLFLDSPLPEILDGVLRRHPLWYAGEDEPPPYQEFRTFSAVQRAAKAVEKAEFLGGYLLSMIDFRLQDLQEAGRRLDGDNLKGRTVFLTALLNSALGRDFRFAPLGREEALEALPKIWANDSPPRRARPELVESALAWSKALGSVPENRQEHLREFVQEAMAMLEEEFGHLAAGELPDPRFTRGLWIE